MNSPSGLLLNGMDLRFPLSPEEIFARVRAFMNLPCTYLGICLVKSFITVNDVALPDSSYLKFETTGYPSSIYGE